MENRTPSDGYVQLGAALLRTCLERIASNPHHPAVQQREWQWLWSPLAAQCAAATSMDIVTIRIMAWEDGILLGVTRDPLPALAPVPPLVQSPPFKLFSALAAWPPEREIDAP